MRFKRRSVPYAELKDADYLYEKSRGRNFYRSQKPEIERQLVVRMRAGDRAARAALIESMVGLVYKIARSYTWSGVDFGDLVAEGAWGATEGIDKYNPNRGTQLSTCAALYILRRIRLAAAKGDGAIELPLRKRRSVALKYHSIQDWDGEANDREIERVDASIDAEAVLASVKRDRDREMMRLYYGVGTGQPLTLKQIGRKYGITRERVRQIIKRTTGMIRWEFAGSGRYA